MGRNINSFRQFHGGYRLPGMYFCNVQNQRLLIWWTFYAYFDFAFTFPNFLCYIFSSDILSRNTVFHEHDERNGVLLLWLLFQWIVLDHVLLRTLGILDEILDRSLQFREPG